MQALLHRTLRPYFCDMKLIMGSGVDGPLPFLILGFWVAAVLARHGSSLLQYAGCISQSFHCRARSRLPTDETKPFQESKE